MIQCVTSHKYALLSYTAAAAGSTGNELFSDVTRDKINKQRVVIAAVLQQQQQQLGAENTTLLEDAAVFAHRISLRTDRMRSNSTSFKNSATSAYNAC